MSELTSEDCKKFLTSKFPNTTNKNWKRIRKFKYQDQWCREFNAKQVGTVFLLENGTSFSFIKKSVIDQVDSMTDIKQISVVDDSLLSYTFKDTDLRVVYDIFHEFINSDVVTIENFKCTDKSFLNSLFYFSFHKNDNRLFVKIDSKFKNCLDQPRKFYENAFNLDKFNFKETMTKLFYLINDDVESIHFVFKKLTNIGISFNELESTYIPKELNIKQELKTLMYQEPINIFKKAFNEGPDALKKLFSDGFSQNEKIKNSSYLSYSFHQEDYEAFKAIVDSLNDVSSDTIWKDLYLYSNQESSTEYLEYLINNGKVNFDAASDVFASNFLNAIYHHNKYEKYKHRVSFEHIAVFAFNKSINDKEHYDRLKDDVVLAINDYSNIISNNPDTILNLIDGYIIEDILNKLIDKGDILISGTPLKEYLEKVRNQASIGFGSLDVLERNFIQSYYKKAIDRI